LIRKLVTRMKAALKVDLTQIDGMGDFRCPRCGAVISPDDTSEESYKVLDVRSKGESLEELVILCNGCGSTIRIVGFEGLSIQEEEQEPPVKPEQLKGKTDDQVLQLLQDGLPLSLTEIAERLEKKPKVVFRSLRRLFEKGKIVSDPKTRGYMLAKAS